MKESRWLEFGTAVLTVEVETGYIRQEVSKGPVVCGRFLASAAAGSSRHRGPR